MNNKIRIARTNDINSISSTDTSRLASGQPFYDAKNRLLYIGSTPEYEISSYTDDNIVWTGDGMITNTTQLSNFFILPDMSNPDDIYKDIYVLSFKGWVVTNDVLNLGYFIWEDQWGGTYSTATIFKSQTNSLGIKNANNQWLGVAFYSKEMQNNTENFIDKVHMVLKIKNSVVFNTQNPYVRNLKPWNSINAYNVIGKIKNTPITDIFNLDNSGLIKEVKKANHATTATIGQYASSDTSKGTIEQRLTNLEHKESAVDLGGGTWADENVLIREGNFVIGRLVGVTPYSTNIGTIPQNFRPKIDLSFGVIEKRRVWVSDTATNASGEFNFSSPYITISASTGNIVIHQPNQQQNLNPSGYYGISDPSYPVGTPDDQKDDKWTCYFGYEANPIA